MLNSPFEPWPNFTLEEADAVSRVLLSNKVNAWTGTEVRSFEKEFTEFANTKHAIALANGTLALDLALHGLGIGSRNGGTAKDEVIVTPRSFLASASSIVNAGAKVVFADVDLESQNIEAHTIAPMIGDETRAILAVHLAGWPTDIDAIRAVIGKRPIKIIEDCAQAHGAQYKGQPVGSLGDVAAWSFCQDKIMTTGGEGGMVTCDDDALWERMWAFKDHGKSYDAVFNRQHPPGFRWVHESIGTNWRLTEMQAAIGRIQLTRMPKWHAERAAIAKTLIDRLAPFCGAGKPLRMPSPACAGCDGQCGNTNRACRHAYYRVYGFVQPENLPNGMSRDDVIAAFNENGIFCMQGSCSELYLEKAFDGSDARPQNRLPNAKQLGETSLMFLCHPGVDYETIDRSKFDVFAMG